jgi:glutathione synthase/RimK-type ligase-like ATP-grasp enzyme
MLSGDLGIMICETSGSLPFPEKSYYRRLCTVGEALGIQVFVFSPHRISWATQKVPGYTYDKTAGRWIKNIFTLPKLIYDRCFYKNRLQYQQHRDHIARLRLTKSVRFLGQNLKGKWAVQQTLMREPSVQPYLPPSQHYSGPRLLIHWLHHKGEAFLKPETGSQGRRVLHIVKYTSNHYTARGRDGHNRPVEVKFDRLLSLLQWISLFIRGRKYLIQDYLTLTTRAGKAFDIRSLVQKDGHGKWHYTGMAVRCGEEGSLTSNLHGGGSAVEPYPFLEEQYGKKKTEDIVAIIRELSQRIPPCLEQKYGSFIELGIDFGIDQQGQVWVLEVNSKPGRAVFLNLCNTNLKKRSIRNPIHYACYILDRQLGG